jgi:hypothetical protein
MRAKGAEIKVFYRARARRLEIFRGLSGVNAYRFKKLYAAVVDQRAKVSGGRRRRPQADMPRGSGIYVACSLASASVGVDPRLEWSVGK